MPPIVVNPDFDPRGDERCGTCRFFYFGPNPNTDTDGVCHRLPPPPVPGQLEAEWPRVRSGDSWCGEYKPQPQVNP